MDPGLFSYNIPFLYILYTTLVQDPCLGSSTRSMSQEPTGSMPKPKSKSIVPHPLSYVTPEAEPEPEVEVEPVRQRAGYLLLIVYIYIVVFSPFSILKNIYLRSAGNTI